MPLPEQSPLMLFHDLASTPSETQLAQWPPHITVVPYFRHDIIPIQEVVKAVEWITLTTGPIPIALGKVAHYASMRDPETGRKGKVSVTEIIDKQGALYQFHNSLIDVLGELGCSFVDTTYVSERYAPHISHKGLQRPPELPKTPYAINAVSLASRVPSTTGKNKVIVKHIPFQL